jgi:serine/threonine protein kinase/tetratricopeptide (TPR) repeat protein
MELPFQVDKYHFNNQRQASVLGDTFSGFSLEDQSPVFSFVFNEHILTEAQIEELRRATVVLAQKEHANVLKPLAWGVVEGRHYVAFPDFGRSLSSYENLKALPAAEMLFVLTQLLKALAFAESKEIMSHGFLRPENIRIALDSSEVKLAFFGYPAHELREDFAVTSESEILQGHMPPMVMADTMEPFQRDVYGLGLVGLELATAHASKDLLTESDRLNADRLRQILGEQQQLPLPLQELLYKMLTPVAEQRYSSFKQALDDVQGLGGKEQTGLRLTTFILDTLINGRFKLGGEVAHSRLSHVYSALDMRGTEETSDDRACVVKLTDLFHTRFKQLTSVRHEHLMSVYDVGVHFENGFVAMEAGLQSLEQLLIKRGTLPLPDAGRIVFQLCKALEGLQFSHISHHGAIKPSNVFLTTDLRTVKLGDALTAEYFLLHGNLNYTGAEYYTPEMIREQTIDIRSDIYALGTLFFEMLVGHPPFCFKIEPEIVEEHLNVHAAVRVEPALMSQEVKDMILRMLEKNPSVRYQTVEDLKGDLTRLLGYDKKQQVEVPNLLFDFAELSMVGKNTREKGEETLAVRLPAVHNRARGAIGLLVGHGKQTGDASRASEAALRGLRELLFHPGAVGPELARLQKSDPEAFLSEAIAHLNQQLYREAFSTGKVKSYGLSAILAIAQENTLYLYKVGDVEFSIFTRGTILDQATDKWTIIDEINVGNVDNALSGEVHERIGFGEVVRVQRLKRRLRDGDQLILISSALLHALSVSEVKELVTSTSEPSQAIELIRGDAIRRRLEGTISCVLLSIGNVTAFADENVSHAKKGLLARNFLAQGDTYLNDGRIDEAIEQYNQALSVNPNFAIIHHQLGTAYIRKGLSSYAISCFERALTLNSKLPSSYLEIADIMVRQGRQREILPLLRKSIAEGCRDAELFARLSRELIRVRNFDEAILYANYALEMNPTHPTAYKDRMSALKRRKALDTKLLGMFSARPRLSDDKKTKIVQEIVAEDDNEL